MNGLPPQYRTQAAQRPPSHPQSPYAVPHRRARSVASRAAACLILLVLAGAIVYICYVKGWLRRARLAPLEFVRVAAVDDGKTVHVLFHGEDPTPDIGEDQGQVFHVLGFHCTVDDGAWSRPELLPPFTSVVLFRNTLWAFHKGGCRKLTGNGWSEVVSDKDWLFPVACVVRGELWLLYMDERETLHVTVSSDGEHWRRTAFSYELHPIRHPSPMRAEFLALQDSPFDVVVFQGHPLVFTLAFCQLRCFSPETLQPPTHEFGYHGSFAVAATDSALYLFEAFDWGFDSGPLGPIFRVGVRTFDGRRWSGRQDLGFTTEGCLSASRVGDEIWLFTSERTRLVCRILRGGRWSESTEMPKPEGRWRYFLRTN